MYFTYSFSSSHRTSNIVDFRTHTHSIKQILYAVALNSQCNAYLLVGHLLFKLITRQIVLGITNIYIYIYISHNQIYESIYNLLVNDTRTMHIYIFYGVRNYAVLHIPFNFAHSNVSPECFPTTIPGPPQGRHRNTPKMTILMQCRIDMRSASNISCTHFNV